MSTAILRLRLVALVPHAGLSPAAGGVMYSTAEDGILSIARYFMRFSAERSIMAVLDVAEYGVVPEYDEVAVRLF